jgi:sulfhydrogenase subunit alpha
MTNKGDGTKIIKVDTLARVEGEGALYIKIKDNAVQDVRLKIFEPPRFFEAFLRDRDFREVPDITARICGICPVAYQMSSVHAMEDALGLKIDGPLRELRRLLYCGEWIESHVLHIFMLHAPDFLGYEDAIKMAKDHGEIVERGLKLKKVGNDLMAKIGGREIHPINVRVGGFYKVFKKRELNDLVEQLKWARDAALETVRWTATLPFQEFEQDYEFVSLRHPSEYPINEGRLVSSAGLDIDITQFDQHFEEQHVEHSNALHSVLKERDAYFVGPMARFNLNFDRLPSIAQEAAIQAGLPGKCNNPFKSIIVRSVEVLYACDEALRILENYEMPDSPYLEIEPKAGTGYGCTEAPRGILYHRYTIDDSGKVLDAQIVPPTSQNQKTIENDLWHFVKKYLDLPDAELTWQCEQAIRNYDPCISCATHFLKLEMDRE